MTATGALIARHVADLFPTQTSRFDLAQAARRGVISPLRCLRIPPGPGVRTIAKVPLRKGEVDQDFDQEELAALLDQEPFNVAIADLYKTALPQGPRRPLHGRRPARQERRQGASGRRDRRPRRLRRDAEARTGRDPRRLRARRGRRALQRDAARRGLELAAGDDLHAPGADRLAADLPAAGRPRHPAGAGQGGGPGDRLRPPGDDPRRDDRHPAQPARPRRLPRRRDRGRPGAARRAGAGCGSSGGSSPSPTIEERRMQVLEREIWRIAVENLDYPEQHAWAALAGARVNPQGWRRARAMLQNDQTKELRRRFLLTCVQRNRNSQLRLKALARDRRPRATPRPSTTRSTSSAPGAATTSGPGRRRCCRRWSTSGSAAATRRRRGSGGSPPTPASCTRSTRCSAGRRRSGCSACWSTPPGGRTGATRGGSSTRRANRTGAWRWRCSPPPSPTRPRARRCCAGRGCGWPANPRRSPASCCATSPKAASGGANAARQAGRAGRERRRERQGRERRRRGGAKAGGAKGDADSELG